MITNKDLDQIIGTSSILKEFPPSGQKRVFLVNKDNNQLIMKIASFEDKRVHREIDIVTGNSIPNIPQIVEVLEYESLDSEKYLVYFEEYIEGESLKSMLKVRKLSLVEGIRLIESLLTTVVYLETIPIVHRDIKPENIICKGEDFFLIDLGIARELNQTSLTQTGASVGPHTPGYGAPELFVYDKINIDSRADLFSLGIVAFEALTGQHPFLKGDEMFVQDVWERTLTVSPETYIIEGDTNKQLISYIQTLMQKHITRRPPNAVVANQLFQAVLPTLKKE